VLKTVARRLDEARIAYMPTGSIALNYYAVPRMTRAVGVVVELGPDDADRVIRLFEIDAYVDPGAVRRDLDARDVQGERRPCQRRQGSAGRPCRGPPPPELAGSRRDVRT